MRALLKCNNKLIAAEIFEISVCGKDDYSIELPDDVIILHLLCAQRYEDCEEGHWNFQIFCESRNQAESFVKELYHEGFLDLTEYEKYTYANIDEDLEEDELENIKRQIKELMLHRTFAIDSQYTEKPDWERNDREKYAWEE